MKMNFSKVFFIGLICCLLYHAKVDAQYCIPTSTYISTNNTVLVETTLGVTNFSNASGVGITGASYGYSDYTDAHGASAIQGTSLDFLLHSLPSGSNCYTKIWIDWNQNGIFETSEEVYSYTTSPGLKIFSGTINVPLTALAGETVMRTRTVWAGDGGAASLAPCGNIGWGEAEDYSFTVIAATPCDELTIEAGTLADVLSCPSVTFTIVNTGSTMGAGMDRVWQSSPAGAGTWTTIAGAIGVNLTVTGGITSATDYRCIVSCPASGESDTTNVALADLSPFSDCYCIPTASNVSTNNTVLVETTLGVTNFSNSSGVGITGTSFGYSDYTDVHEVSAVQGTSFDFLLHSLPSGSNCYMKIWIDWNQNGIFETSEEVYSYTLSPGMKIFSGTINVPLTALPGETVMRTRTVWAGDAGAASMGPCGNVGWGEAEDYTMVVIPALPCEEVPLNAGTLADVEICPSIGFIVSNTGTSLGLGFDRVWQQSVDGGTTWTVIAGATEVNYINPTGITTETQYRCIVSCPASGDIDTTNVATAALSSFLDCYCIPTASNVSTNNTVLVETTLGVTNFSNSSGVGITGTSFGYSDYTDVHEVSAVQGTSFDFLLHSLPSGSNCYMKIWVDWNQNGIFETSEEVYSYTLSPGMKIFSGTINVPLTALPGETVMRTRTVWAGDGGAASMGPCGNVGWGEAEDYSMVVIPALPCEELDLVAGSLADIAICPSVGFIVSNTGTSVGLGFDRVWQRSVDGGTTWTTIAGAVDVNYINAAGVTVNTDYRCIVSCPATGESDTTNIANVTVNPFYDCYCVPVSTYEATNHTTLVSTTLGVTNFSNASGVGITGTSYGYSDYTDVHEVSAVQATSFDFLANTVPTGSNCYFKIWIDWNQNGIFETSEEVYSYTIAPGVKIFSGTINVPLTALPGETVMRTRSFYSYTELGLLTPCSTIGWGEAEDYRMIVIPAVSCADASVSFPTSATSSSFPENVCETGDVTLSVTTAMPLAAGITYQWQSSPTATGPWTNISTPSLFSTYFHAGVSANTYFRCHIRCEGTTQMYSSTVLVQSVTPEIPEVSDAQTCGPGSATLTGTVGSGNIFWFENPTGGMAFASGLEVETPPIATTTTFYAAGGAFSPSQIEVGSDNYVTSFTNAGPFNQYYRRYTMQLMYTKAQLDAEGAIPGNFDAVSFYMASAVAVPFPNYTVSIKTVPATSMAALTTWQTTGMTQVFGGTGTTYTPSSTPGWQQLDFSTPINWDGNSHIIVQICWSQNTGFAWASGGTNWYSNTPGRMLFAGSNDAGSSCGLIGTSTSNNLPDAKFNFTGCVSERVPVIAYVRDTPTIHINVEDGEYCLFNNTFDIPTSPAQPAGSTFIWNTGGTDSFARVSTDGTPTNFWVEVTNEWGCTNSDSVKLTLKPSPEIDLGSDTLVCEGGVVTLDAGSGHTNHYWNTGETTRKITVDDGGEYSVLVENEFGCLATDTINVTIEGYAPSVAGIIVDNLGEYTFQFIPSHPMHVLNYHWDFGDGNTSVSANPMHTYDTSGTYLVTLTIESTCGKRAYTTYTTIVQSVDEYELSQNHLKLYPNPTNSILNIESIGNIKMNKLTIINMLGQEVYVQDMNKVELFQLDVSRFANGAYHVVIESDKGRMTKKFQILK